MTPLHKFDLTESDFNLFTNSNCFDLDR